MSAREAKGIARAILSVIPELSYETFCIVGAPNPFSDTDDVRFCKVNNSSVCIGRAHATFRRSLIARTRADLHDLKFVTVANYTIRRIVLDVLNTCHFSPCNGKSGIRLFDDIPPWVWYTDSTGLGFIASKEVSRIVGLELKCGTLSHHIDILLDSLGRVALPRE